MELSRRGRGGAGRDPLRDRPGRHRRLPVPGRDSRPSRLRSPPSASPWRSRAGRRCARPFGHSLICSSASPGSRRAGFQLTPHLRRHTRGSSGGEDRWIEALRGRGVGRGDRTVEVTATSAAGDPALPLDRERRGRRHVERAVRALSAAMLGTPTASSPTLGGRSRSDLAAHDSCPAARRGSMALDPGWVDRPRGRSRRSTVRQITGELPALGPGSRHRSPSPHAPVRHRLRARARAGDAPPPRA